MSLPRKSELKNWPLRSLFYMCSFQVNQDTKKKAGVAGRFTEKVVEKHDVCRKFFLEKGRERVSRRHKSLRSWRRILVNQTHPLALWHDPSYEPKSLVYASLLKGMIIVKLKIYIILAHAQRNLMQPILMSNKSECASKRTHAV